MQEKPFSAWLKDEKKYQRETIRSRLENCRTIQRHEGDLDAQWEADRLEALLDRFSYSKDDERHDRPPRHRVPIGGVVYTRTATLKQAIGLYKAFRDAQSDKRDSAADRDPWDRYLDDVRRCLESGRLDSEVDYKLKIGDALSEARRAVLAGRNDWSDLVKRAATQGDYHPMAWRSANKLGQLDRRRSRRGASGPPLPLDRGGPTNQPAYSRLFRPLPLEVHGRRSATRGS